MRYRLDLAYDGTDFHGWQIQPNGISVQEVIQKSLSKILNSPIETLGCGRTDSGVHAKYFVAHFDFEGTMPESMVYKLNSILPNSVRIFDILPTHDEFHARFDAVSREYEYYIQIKSNPFTARYAWVFQTPLDIDSMNKACNLLIGEHEFKAFCKGLPSTDHYRCTVDAALWENRGDQLVFKISANRFLRNMVRAIVGTCVLVGLNKMSVDDFAELIKTGTRSDAGNSVPAQGLFLTKITY